MKKLTIFLAIALIANVCSAVQMDILVNEQAWTGGDVGPSDIITVLWINDVAGTGGGFANLHIDLSNGDYVADSAYINPFLQMNGIDIAPDTELGGFDVWMRGSHYMELPLETMASFAFHVPDYKVDSDIIIIDPYVGAWLGVYAAVGTDDQLPYVELHVTPEPTTIALLGIGALSLLRRRRKA